MASENKKLDLKTLGLILLVPIGLFAGYFMFFSGAGDEVATDESKNEIPIPESKDDGVSKNKAQIYNEEKERLEKEKVEQKRTTTSSEDFYDQATSDETEKEKKVLSTDDETEEGNKRTVTRSYVSSQEVKQEEKKKEVKQEVVVEDKKDLNDPGGFGIVRSSDSGNGIKKEVTDNSNIGSKEFYTVMLEEDTKIKNQSSVVFYLTEDCYLDGIKIEKNSYLFGKAEDRGGVFDIRIKQVKTRGGKTIALNNVYVYDENYSRGLAYEGRLNESLKEGTDETVNDVSGSVASSTSSTGLGIAVNAVDNTIKAMTRNKGESSISLSRGYKVYIKKD